MDFVLLVYLAVSVLTYDFITFVPSVPLILLWFFSTLFILVALRFKKNLGRGVVLLTLGIWIATSFWAFVDVGRLASLWNKPSLGKSTTKLGFCTLNTSWKGPFEQDFVQYLVTNNCRLVFLQEIWDYIDFSETTSHIFPYHLPNNELQTFYTNLYAVYPTVKKWREFIIAGNFEVTEEYHSTWEGFYAIKAVLANNPQPLWLINVHIWTPLVLRPTRSLLIATEYAAEFKSPYISPLELRKAQLLELRQFLKNVTKENAPILLAGDFNSLPSNVFVWYTLPSFGLIKYSPGVVALPTFADYLPIIMIDHVYGRGLRLVEVKHQFNRFSDHTLVKGELVF